MKAAGDFEVVSGNLNFHVFPPSIIVDCLVMKMYACFRDSASNFAIY
jgi:hypothetical protein